MEEEKRVSEGEQESIEEGSEGELAANKENDNETFNSASSSATFISMTNHVKLFKLKLRSLNTPLPLWVLNLVLFLVMVGIFGGFIFTSMNNTHKIEIGMINFKNQMQTSLILD